VTGDPFPHLDLSCLTPRQREVVEMHYASNVSERGIALLLGISRRSVRIHHMRALEKLADALSPSAD
jgi:RNA polymerase sigma factor (sigma-70 family)